MYVKRFLRFRTPAALFGPADVMAAAPVLVLPPPMTIPPGPAPVTKKRLGENVANGNESKPNAERENPALNVLRTRGEKTCVSRTLATWARSVVYDPNKGSASGVRLLPSSIVYATESESRSRML